MSRTLDRSIARKHYAKFARMWREDLRRAGLYGKPNSPKRPRFNQWYAMHAHDTKMAAQPTPQDVAQHLAPDHDPWTEVDAREPSNKEPKPERGVVTIDMVGRDDDE
jgi:hypothetical protein